MNRINRRKFAQVGAFAAWSLKARTSLAAEFDYPWKLGIITDEVDPDLSRVLRSFYPQYHLGWAEIRNVKLDGRSRYVYKSATPTQLREIKNQLGANHVKVSVLDTGVYKIALPGTTPLGENAADLNPETGQYSKQMEDLKRAADAAHALGTEYVRIFSFKRVKDPNTIFDRVVDELGKAITIAKEQAITLLLENEFDCNVGTGEETARLFKAIPERTLMHNWDPGNCSEAGEEPFPKAWNQLDHTRIKHIHLKDARGKKWEPIGRGTIDFAGQFRALKKMKYEGTLSLETHYLNAQKDPYTSSVESMDGLVRILKET